MVEEPVVREASANEVGPGHKRVTPPRGGLVRRRRILGGVIAGTVILTGAGAGAAAVLKSPAQVAAEKAPPPADILTAPVEKRVLSASLVTRGKVVASQRVDVMSAGLSGADTIRPVVTKVKVKPGDVVKPGAVLVEVAGRPVLALHGSLPAYRNLTAGAVGQDVVQLQKGLAQLGYRRGADASGTFGSGTQRALKSLYTAAGYSAPTSAGMKSDAGKADGAKPGEPQDKDITPGVRTGTQPTVMLLASEVVFVSESPVRVESVDAVVGTTATERLMTVTAGALAVDGTLESYQKELVRPGQKVEIFSDRTGERARGKVASVGPAPTPSGKDAAPATGVPQYQVKITSDEPLSGDFAGQDVRLTISAASSNGEVLAVPAAAVSSRADGRTTLDVLTEEGKQTRVEIRTGMTGDGAVEVIPVSGSLAPGDRVVLGVGQAPAPVDGKP